MLLKDEVEAYAQASTLQKKTAHYKAIIAALNTAANRYKQLT